MRKLTCVCACMCMCDCTRLREQQCGLVYQAGASDEDLYNKW